MKRGTRMLWLVVTVVGLLAFTANAMELNYLGSFEPPREGWVFEDVEIGEISGLTLSTLGTFYAIGDDRGDVVNPPGVLYEMEIAVDLEGIHAVEVTGLIQLDSDSCSTCVQPYAAGTLDGEEVLWLDKGFIVCSERDSNNMPWIRQFTHSGELVGDLPIPTKFLPEFLNGVQVRGVRENLSFEAATVTPDGSTLFVANEQALVQDGPVSTADAGTTIRIIEYDLTGHAPTIVGEYVYVTEPIFALTEEGNFADNGVPGMVYVGHITSDLDLIMMERSYVSGTGNHIGLYGVKLAPYIYDREKIMNTESLSPYGLPYSGLRLKKTPLLTLSDDPGETSLEFDPDNMEAIALGPQLENGNYSLILASDNNFNPEYQRNVYAAFEIDVNDSVLSAIVLGSGGGPREDDLSSYMIFPSHAPEEAISLDAGSLTTGIRRAEELGNLWDFDVPSDSRLTREGFIYQSIKAYLFSHAHLDHTSGHYINAPVDIYGAKKQILGLQSTIDNIASGIYNWRNWVDFVALGYYDYAVLSPGFDTAISGTSMAVEAYPVSHGAPYESTAFLIRYGEYYLLYFGDVGPEGIEETGLLSTVWDRVVPLIANGKLLGMFLEVSYAEGRPDSLLFGHLTPSWMMAELHELAQRVAPLNPYEALAGLPVVVTHIKPVFERIEPPRNTIARQLSQLNDLGIEFIIPYQGMRIDFRPWR